MIKYITFIADCEKCGETHTRIRFIPLQEERKDGINYFAICVNTGEAIYRKLTMSKTTEQPPKLRKRRKSTGSKVTHQQPKDRPFKEGSQVERK